MKKYLWFILFVLFLSPVVCAKDCVTGFACSINGEKEQVETTDGNINGENNQNAEKPKKNKKKRKSFFVDGGEYNRPEYTEIFMKNIIMP
ncbi:MAG: hypothetical protein K6C94_00075 [Candidatus Gastranaerophilales bacterium]|nr:hypothetical protein [Candidatus Gastranaerophilales bacterium]